MSRRHGRMASAAAVVSFLLTGCFPPFGPVFGFPPIGETSLAVENRTDQDWVLRVMADGFPQDFAIPAGKSGEAYLYSTPSGVVLLDTDCTVQDELEWTDGADGVLIAAGSLALGSAGPEGESFMEYFECSSGLGLAPTAGDPQPEASGRIAVLGQDVATWEVDPTTAEVTPLGTPPEPGMDAEHAPSPDGTRVAFVRYTDMSSDLFVADADLANEELLAENADMPTWSPDGARIAYLDLDPFSGGASLSVMDADGGEPIRLAEDATIARWSPDGQRIAFISMDFDATFEPGDAELMIVNADGSGLETLAEASPFADRPAWSPDGSAIVFTAGTEMESTLARVDLADRSVTTLADPEGASVLEPAWSPDGSRIAFVITSAGLFTQEAAMGIVPAHGGEIQRIGETENGYWGSPTWSPDGSWLAAARSGATDFAADLVVIRPDGADETVLAIGVLSVVGWRD